MHNNYEQLKFEIEVLEKCCEGIRNAELVKIAESVIRNIEEIAVALAMPHALMKESVKQLKALQYHFECVAANKIEIDPKTDEHIELLRNYVTNKMEASTKEQSDEARNLLRNLRISSPIVDNAITTQALNSLVNIWTIFESVSKDIWIFLLNSYQTIFLNCILESSGDGQVEGLSGKYISISLLGKYGFDLNNKLGDILVGKYDFTSCVGIKKAFVDLRKENRRRLDFLDTRYLYQFEGLRNLIVHKAGIVDVLYLSKYDQNDNEVGKRVQIDNGKYELYVEAVIYSLAELLRYADDLVS